MEVTLRRRLAVALLALAPLRAATGGDPVAPVPFPKEGLDAPFAGIPGLPLEWKDGSGDLRRRNARPRRLPEAQGHAWVVEFDYGYAEPAARQAALYEKRAIQVTVTAFHRAGLAHAWLNARLTEVTAEEMDAGEARAVRPWDEGLSRVELPGLCFRGSKSTAVDLVGITRHVAIDVRWERRPSAGERGELPESVTAMRQRVTATWESLIGVVEKAPPARSESAFHVSRVLIELLGEARLGFFKYRVTASAKSDPSRRWLPALLWVDDREYRNDATGTPSGSVSAEVTATGFDSIGIYDVDDGPVFRLFAVGKFRDHRLGYVWP